jgi:peptidoglycan/LPS O-acetylase OafA/YrhL
MLFHLAVVSQKLEISPNYRVAGAPDFPELSFLSVGWVGVEIFFVLSGFVIAQSADGRAAFDFLRGRAGRLMPAIWICATITVVIVLLFKMALLGPVFSSYIKTLVMYPNGPWISNVYWTLTVEIMFYPCLFSRPARVLFRAWHPDLVE